MVYININIIYINILAVLTFKFTGALIIISQHYIISWDYRLLLPIFVILLIGLILFLGNDLNLKQQAFEKFLKYIVLFSKAC